MCEWGDRVEKERGGKRDRQTGRQPNTQRPIQTDRERLGQTRVQRRTGGEAGRGRDLETEENRQCPKYIAGFSESVLATEVNGHFFADPGSDEHLQQVPRGGIRLFKVTPVESGQYFVYVHVQSGENITTYVQRANVVVAGTS